ncbi:MAG: hypothetical protein HUJ68_13550 [Clostridia bacterium]|nr:hypothetical protein [Clostridia bacterium]
MRNNFDKILTYDFNDSLKYSFDYYPTPYSKIDIELDDHYSSDVYFLGFAKDRLHTVLNAYDELSNHGFKCRFIIAGDIKDEIKRKYPNITFGVRIPYTENLKYVRNTKFVLEIMQTGAVGITPRVWESIAYDKYLITNNHFVKNTNVYNSDMMYVFNEYSEIPVFVEKNINRAIKYPDNLIETISPINLLKVLNFN